MSDIDRYEAYDISKAEVQTLEEMLEERGLSRLLEALDLLCGEHAMAASYSRTRTSLGRSVADWNLRIRAIDAARKVMT